MSTTREAPDPTTTRDLVGALLYAWYQAFGSQPMAMRHVLTSTECRRLAMRLRSAKSARAALTPHEFSNMLKPYMGVRIDGYALERASEKKSSDGWRWRVTSKKEKAGPSRLAAPAAARVQHGKSVTLFTTNPTKLTITTGADGTIEVTIG